MLSDLGMKMLVITARRGYTGADREVFFHYLHGIRYAEMEREVLALEREGFISVEWVGPSNFTVSITSEGVEMAKALEDDVWHKSEEALEQMERKKREIKSVLDEKGEHSYILHDNTGIEEVGDISSDIVDKLDEQIRAERGNPYEEEVSYEGEVPLEGEIQDEAPYHQDEDVVERRIEGEIEDELSQEGREIHLKIGNKDLEDRIAVGQRTQVKRRVKEKRISGETEESDSEEGKDIPIELNANDIGPIEDKVVEYQYSATGTGQSMASEEKEEEKVPEPPDNIKDSISDSNPDDKGIPQSSKETPIEDLSNIDIYKQIVEAISLQGPILDDESSMMVVSDELTCMWETDRFCPLKMKKGTAKETTVTPNHCTVCQLIEIKKLLKKQVD
jgi:hypothetical protein